MFASHLIRFVAVTAILGTISHSVHADSIQIGNLSGFIDPFAYTTSEGTFTTSQITLSLSSSGSSFLIHDGIPGPFMSHVEINISFNDGRPNGGANLFGTLIIEDNGTSPGFGIPFEANINGMINGAGPFDGTRLFGVSGHRWGFFFHEWTFRRETNFLDLPPIFINGDAIPITGGMTAQLIPEPTTILFLGTGLVGVALRVHKRRKASKNEDA